jgi:integrase
MTPHILRPSEIAAYLAAAQRLDPASVASLALGAFAGLRRLEMQALRWSMIESDCLQITGASTKSGKSRSIPIHPTLRLWLATIPRGEDEQLVVPHDHEKHLGALTTHFNPSPSRSAPPCTSNSLRLTYLSYIRAEAIMLHKPRRSCVRITGGKITTRDVKAYWAIYPETTKPRLQNRNQPPKSS